MDLKKSLTELGLHKNEAAVYLALLHSGLTKAGPLVQTTKLHRMLVYNALDNLIDQGLVTVVHKNRVKLFQAADPTALVEQTRRLSELAHQLIPDLRKLQDKHNEVISVRSLVGQEGFRINLENIIESALRHKPKEMRIIGGARDLDFYEAIGDWYPDYVKLLEKTGVKKRLLAPTSFSSVFKKKFAAEKNTQLRTLPHGLSSPSYTRITEDMVSIEIYQPQLVVIQINNKTIAQGYLDSFELLWKSASPSKK